MSSSEFHERFRSNPLCDFRLGTVATSDHETPLTREEHEATHVPLRDWCAHYMMGRGRTHHHVEDQSRRPIVAMDYFFMKMESAPSVQAISEESIICVAVKEDTHQNIMSSVALKKGVEPWTIERAVKFIGLLGYRERATQSLQ